MLKDIENSFYRCKFKKTWINGCRPTKKQELLRLWKNCMLEYHQILVALYDYFQDSNSFAFIW